MVASLLMKGNRSLSRRSEKMLEKRKSIATVLLILLAFSSLLFAATGKTIHNLKKMVGSRDGALSLGTTYLFLPVS
jgi:hypothetical protein